MAKEEKTGLRTLKPEPPMRSDSSASVVIRPKEWDRQAPTATERATPEQIIECLLDLEMVFQGPNMDPKQASRKYRLYCGDLGHLTTLQLQTACRRYRLNPDNFRFPTPGQLLALAK